ncbi:MAG: hypothetical protein M3O70_15980 [Actinomycetota bacterium]|nr:hypothetical protein [Actinomycetota bacterium]
MAFRIEELPALDSAGALGRRTADSPLVDAYRDTATPSIATQVASLGVALGIDAVRVLQERFLTRDQDLVVLQHQGPAPPYSTWPDCAYPDTDGCAEPCYGFEPHHMDTFYCATCDEQAADPDHNPSWNWHFTGSRGSIQYMDREPDVCNGRDAWKWKIDGACRDCNENIVFRCHDGWKKYSADGPLTPTICEGIISCDNQLTLCP